jgi:hypothetical protein
MASTYSQYKIELIGTGERGRSTWGIITNNNFGSATPGTYRGFEQAIGGRADVTICRRYNGHALTLTDSNAALRTLGPLYLDLVGYAWLGLLTLGSAGASKVVSC